MTNEPENRNESINEGQEEQARPKKKNIIQIFRPQNSKTGMVKSGPRPGAPKRPAGPRSAAGGRPVPGKGMMRPPEGARPAPKAPEGGRMPVRPADGVRPHARMAEGEKPVSKAAAGAAALTGAPAPAGETKAAAADLQPNVSAVAGTGAVSTEKEVMSAAQIVKSEPLSPAAAQTKDHISKTDAAKGSGTIPASVEPAPVTKDAGPEETAKKTAQTAEKPEVKVKPEVKEKPEAKEKRDVKDVPEMKEKPEAKERPEIKERPEAKKTSPAERPARPLSQERPASGAASSQTARPGTGAGERRPGVVRRSPDQAGTRPVSPEARARAQDSRSERPAFSQDRRPERTQTTGMPRRDGTRVSASGQRIAGAPGRPSLSRDGRPGVRPAGDQRGTAAPARGMRPAPGQAARPGARPAVPEKPFEKEGRVKNERGRGNDRRTDRNEKGDKFDRMERTKVQGGKNAPKGKQPVKNAKPPVPAVKEEEKIKSIILPDVITIKELAEKMKIQAAAIVKKLFLQGKMVTVNEEVDFETAEEIAIDYDIICEKEVKVDVIEELLKESEEDPSLMVTRPPVVCVMGHVDHGKTSLLDAIRNTRVIEREAGGITQHIGASVVECNGQKITFLDTPGHEAFTAMRMRGANSTDIAILVVAADDGVMPQTVEAINHAKAAGIEIIVAINKIDKPGANVEKVKQELTEYELVPEDWGGSTVFVPVSAKTHEGIDSLLEMILLTAEVLELKANPNRQARGLIIEARLDKGRGPVATVLVQKGTLHVGDFICAGSCHGKVRAMLDDKGRNVTEAGPSTPVEILGFNDVPGAGEILVAPATEKEARSFAETFIRESRQRLIEDTKQKMSLDDLFSQIKAGNLKELNLIVKADVQGSVEAVKQSLLKLSNEEVVVKVIHSGAGAINESDVILASASNAIIIGFNVKPDVQAKSTAEHEGVDIRLYRVIYDAIADVEAAMKGMLDPIFEEKIIGHAVVRQTFRASGVGTIAGAYVLDGVFTRGCSARISREGKQLFDGSVASLKRFKDDVKEVKAGYECGLVFENFSDLKEDDQIEAYTMVEVPR